MHEITKVRSDSVQVPPSEGGYVTGGETIDNLVGRMLTLVESLGLKDTQEKAVKDLVRQEIWRPFNSQFIVHISGELHTVIRAAQSDIQKHFESATLSKSPVKIVYELTVSKE
jgi:hypothetical protein